MCARVDMGCKGVQWGRTYLALTAAVRLLELLAVSPRLKVLPGRPHTLTDVLTCTASCCPTMHATQINQCDAQMGGCPLPSASIPVTAALSTLMDKVSKGVKVSRQLAIPSSSPFSRANLMNPGVSSSLLSRFFQTFSKSGPFSGFTCTSLEVHMPASGP